MFPTRILFSKFWLGKKSKPKINPNVIENFANLVFVFFTKKAWNIVTTAEQQNKSASKNKYKIL